MKRASTIGVALLTLFILTLLSSSLPSKAQRNQRRSLDDQALEQAQRFFSGMYTKCGEHYYYKYNRGLAFLYQCKYSPSISVKGETFQPRPLSEADRLNGVDPLPISWDGVAIINLGLCRHQTYYQKDEPGYSAWGQWSDRNDDFLPLTNKKGHWEFHNKLTAIGGDKIIVPVTCEDIPSAEKRASVKLPYWDGKKYDGDILRIPATYGQWFSLGRGPMTIRPFNPYSQIFIDGTNISKGPGGRDVANNEALAPGLNWGAIIIRIGQNSEPTQAFTSTISYLEGYKVTSNEEVFIAINDSYFLDNRGEHAVLVKGQNLSVGQDQSTDATPTSKEDRRGLELDDYCANKYGVGSSAIAEPGNAFSWRCRTTSSNRITRYSKTLNMEDMDEACKMQHGANFISNYENKSDHKSWYCTTTNNRPTLRRRSD
ncbi:MAG TPA: hypothetical protein VFQ47_06160 [Nitrososphaera sp.]|jgi:hypothetical protein|nr:hypothetical protein [Nitrososphaera sp.]